MGLSKPTRVVGERVQLPARSHASAPLQGRLLLVGKRVDGPVGATATSAGPRRGGRALICQQRRDPLLYRCKAIEGLLTIGVYPESALVATCC